jgi:nucleoside-diphosphate-sugar epimerase
MPEGNSTFKRIVLEDLIFLTSEYEIHWEQLRNKTILITGASGFLAAYLIETLLYLNKIRQMNVNIVALSRSRNNFKQRFEIFLKNQDLIFIEQDVCLPVNLDFKIDYIVHAASQASPRFYSKDPVGTLSANTLGTRQLLKLAREHNVDGFLFFSSSEVYGEAAHVPTSESDYGYLDPLKVRSCYAESKRMGENMCVSWHHQYGVPTKIVRPFHTYGPGMKLDDGRVYADFVADAVAGRNIVLKSDGLARRSFCYLADATAAFFMVLLNGANAQAYNIGNPEGEISIGNLAHLVAGLYPKKGISVIFEHRTESEQYIQSNISVSCPDIAKVRNIGWSPLTSIENGFRKTIESY